MTLPKGKSSGRGNSRLSSAIGRAPTEPKARKPLQRTTGLSAVGATGSTLKRTAGPKASARKPRPGGRDAGAAWRDACLMRNVAVFGVATCEATGLHLRPDWSCHHVIEASTLAAHGFGADEFIIWHPGNGMCVNRKPHLDHHNYSPRITADRLQAWHWEFAELLDNTAGHEWASETLRRCYPEADR